MRAEITQPPQLALGGLNAEAQAPSACSPTSFSHYYGLLRRRGFTLHRTAIGGERVSMDAFGGHLRAGRFNFGHRHF
jgi:hypothetical protein